MYLTQISLDHFTAFRKLQVNLSPGINVFIGKNGTGKTHLMKVAYAACDITKSKLDFADKLIRVFLPSGRALGRLVKRQKGSGSKCTIEIHRSDNLKLRASFTNQAKKANITGEKEWKNNPIECVYVPSKEILSNAPGFISLYALREIHFDETYNDVLVRAYMDPQRKIDEGCIRMLAALSQTIGGTIERKGEEFYLHNGHGDTEFTLLAEGIRKLGLLWLLIKNGTLREGSVLFWDEPEANLNPTLIDGLIKILLALERKDVQIFLATHDYVLLKAFDLNLKDENRIRFHSLYHSESGEIEKETVNDYLRIHPNAIAEAYDDIYDRVVERNLKVR